MTRRQYSDSEKAEYLAALDANGGNIRHTARQTGVAATTLADWANGRGVVPECTQLRAQKKEMLKDRLESLAHALLDGMSRRVQSEEVSAVSLKDLATTFGIAVDKMLLLKGDPTSINQHSTMSEEERERLRARLRARLSLVPDDGVTEITEVEHTTESNN